MPSYRRLQQYAVAISIISVIYNGLEGGLSIGFGAESNSRSLIFFGIQSGIEVISALLVVWRFRKISKPGEERSKNLSAQDLQFEKLGTLGIGLLLVALAVGTVASSIAILVLHQEPDASNASLIISASALFFMILIWLPKRYLASALDSSTMRGEAICSLSCIQLTCVLFIGSLIFRLWRGGWWVDGATSMVLSIFFGWEGFKMIRWARSDEFTGGCCEDCRVEPLKETTTDPELGIAEKAHCKDACCDDSEKGSSGDITEGEERKPDIENSCCETSPSGIKSCTKKVLDGPVIGTTSKALEPMKVLPDEETPNAKRHSEDSKDACCSDCE